MTLEEHEEGEEKSRLPAAFAAGAGVVLLLAGGLLLVTRSMQSRRPAGAAVLPFGAPEQAYAAHIHFGGIQMARATNMLNQEFTYVTGTVSNDGAQTVRGLEVTLEFHDPFKQVILREKQQLIGLTTPPLEGGQRRNFQITLEYVPAEWDQQYPSISVTGLNLE
jgi:hypothetical protein